jgi:hypothetical protein
LWLENYLTEKYGLDKISQEEFGTDESGSYVSS